MRRMRIILLSSVVTAGLLTGCTMGDAYPPAVPVAEEYRSPSPVEVPAPPPPPVVEHHASASSLPRRSGCCGSPISHRRPSLYRARGRSGGVPSPPRRPWIPPMPGPS